MPFSPALLFDPAVAYSLLPSGVAMMFLVQWWLMAPAGRSVTFTPGDPMLVSPLRYWNFRMASLSAT